MRILIPLRSLVKITYHKKVNHMAVNRKHRKKATETDSCLVPTCHSLKS